VYEIEPAQTSSACAEETINMNTLNEFGPLLGRVLIALIYLISGFQKITGFEGTVGYIASKGLPLPQIAAIGAIIVELGGGTMLAAPHRKIVPVQVAEGGFATWSPPRERQPKTIRKPYQ